MSDAKDDLAQMREDFHYAVQVFTVLAVVVGMAVLIAAFKEG